MIDVFAAFDWVKRMA